MKLSNKTAYLTVAIIFISSFAFNCFYIQYCEFLFDWDERFHALVAKNLNLDFLKPMLYVKSPIPLNELDWSNSSIWLHKQPLFLWQMALSIKIFGANEFAVRLPSALMLSLLSIIIFRIGKLIFNPMVGIIGALIVVSNRFLVQHINGTIGMDHNDVAFMFYISLSFWSFIEFCQSKKIKHALLIGLFAGMAMLNKWLVGLLVFEALFIYILITKEYNLFSKLLTSVIICLIVFIPWQVYTFYNFPSHALHEWQYNQQHFWRVVEGHSGDILFYLSYLPSQYSWIFPFGIFGIWTVLKKNDRKYIHISILVSILSLFIFFTVAKTKLISYTMPVIPLIILYISYGIFNAINYLKKSNLLFKRSIPILCLIILYFNVNPRKIILDADINEKNWFQNRNKTKQLNTKTYKLLSKLDLPKKTVILGFKDLDEIENMFYNGINGYSEFISLEEINMIMDKGYNIAIFKNKWPQNLPKTTKVIVLPFDYL